LAIVDPGVGTSRKPVVLQAEGCYVVGPDNGLLSVIAARSDRPALWEIVWKPPAVSRSFHGRDLFAPIAARLALGIFPSEALGPLDALEIRFGAEDLAEIVYIDHYGNAITGLRDEAVPTTATLAVHDTDVPHAEVFADVPCGEAFWYVNSSGLVEIACNRANAARKLGLEIGDPVLTRR
jgi:S-adenosylmethionine hydrolase